MKKILCVALLALSACREHHRVDLTDEEIQAMLQKPECLVYAYGNNDQFGFLYFADLGGTGSIYYTPGAANLRTIAGHPSRSLLVVGFQATRQPEDLETRFGIHLRDPESMYNPILAQAPLAKPPVAIAYQPDEQAIWIAQPDAVQSELLVLDPDNLQTRTSIPLGRGLRGLCFSEDGRWALTCQETDGTASWIDVGQRRVVATRSVGEAPSQIASGGDRAAVLNPSNKTISELSISEQRVIQTISLGFTPFQIGYCAALDEIWVGDIDADRLVCLQRTPSGWAEAYHYPNVQINRMLIKSTWLFLVEQDNQISKIDLRSRRVANEAWPARGPIQDITIIP